MSSSDPSIAEQMQAVAQLAHARNERLFRSARWSELAKNLLQSEDAKATNRRTVLSPDARER
jgi:hypothetical protein